MGSNLKRSLREVTTEYLKSGKFTAHDVELGPLDCQLFVEFEKDPNRFVPSIFDGVWARPQRHPEIGTIRLLRVVVGNDGVARIIARQDKRIFAHPWM